MTSQSYLDGVLSGRVNVTGPGVTEETQTNLLTFGDGFQLEHYEDGNQTRVSMVREGESVQRGVSLSGTVTNWSRNGTGGIVGKTAIEATVSGGSGLLHLTSIGFIADTGLTACITMEHGQIIRISGVSGAYLVNETAVTDGLAVYTFRYNGTEWVRIDSWNKCTDGATTNGYNVSSSGTESKTWSLVPGVSDYSGNFVELTLNGGALDLQLSDTGIDPNGSELSLNITVPVSGVASTVTVRNASSAVILSYAFTGTTELRRSAIFRHDGWSWKKCLDQSIVVNGVPVTGLAVDPGLVSIANGVASLAVAGFRLDETIYEEDFADITKLGAGLVTASTGTGATLFQGNINELNGCGRLATGTTTTGSTSVHQSAYRQIRLRHGEVLLAFVIRTAALSNATDAYTISVGATDSAGVNSVILSYTHAINSGAWMLTTTAASTPSTNMSSATVAANTIYRIAIVSDAAGTYVKAYVNGVLVATTDEGIPAVDVSMGAVAKIVKSAGATDTSFYVSKFKARVVNTYESMV